MLNLMEYCHPCGPLGLDLRWRSRQAPAANRMVRSSSARPRATKSLICIIACALLHLIGKFTGNFGILFTQMPYSFGFALVSPVGFLAPRLRRSRSNYAAIE